MPPVQTPRPDFCETKGSGAIRLRIESLAADGLGVGHAGGRAVFVPYTVPGELVLARPANTSGRRLLAEPAGILEPSPWRRRPPCPVFGQCGGCSLMHIADERQLELKLAILRDALSSIAGCQGPAVEMVQSPRALAYRNRGQYPVARRGGRIVSGFFARGTHRVVEVDRCLLHDERVDLAVRAVRAWANHKKICCYEEVAHRGWLRHITARVASGSGQVLVTLVVTEPRRVSSGDLLRRLRRRLPGLVGLAVNFQPARGNVIFGRRTDVWWGQARVAETFGGLEFRLSPVSFFQVNPAVAEELYRRALANLAGPAGVLVDAYCGAGVGALLAARRGWQAVGIDTDQLAIASARETARHNHLAGVEFFTGRAEEVLPRLLRRGLRPSLVLLDPPRGGCAPELLQAVCAGPVGRVNYISCHPGTLARDLKILIAGGFRPVAISALDMFPQTSHLETLVSLERG